LGNTDENFKSPFNLQITIQNPLQLVVLDVSKAGLASFSTSACDPKFRYVVNPNLNRQKFNASSGQPNALEPRAANKTLPANTNLPIVKWSYKTAKEEEAIPVSLTCWPSEGPGVGI